MASHVLLPRIVSRRMALRIAAGLAAVVTAACAPAGTGADGVRIVPLPTADEDNAAAQEVAVLAGGCFWGVQGVFQHVAGVANAVSGYAGGDRASARYFLVGTGITGHAESVQVTFDPRKISYGRILQVYFSVAHDPTELNRQGPDFGTQYRSAIFPQSAEQARVARGYIAQLDQARVFARPIATRVEPDKTFYPAEDYHQDYLTRNPDQPYIVYNDLPKVDNLKRLFPQLWRAEPVLVSAAGTAN